MGRKAQERAIELGAGVTLPLATITETFGLMGQKGWGKTYAAGVLAEQMARVGAQIVVFDPVGNWYGLRLAADGQGPGLAIPIFGGLHGDLPLAKGAGAAVARLIIERGISAVLDVSDFRKSAMKQFMIDFAEEFFHLKKRHRSPVHLFVEEARVFVPEAAQRSGGHDARLVGAFEDLARRGRNYGIGMSLLDQRPQSVSKNVLSQVQNLIIGQLTGKHERKAVREWVTDQGFDAGVADKLPGLQRGQAYLWSPGRDVFRRIQIGQKWTYDASATPEFGAELQHPPHLEDLDMDELGAALAEVADVVEADDPKALKKKLAARDREIEKLRAKITQPAPPAPPPVTAAEMGLLKDAAHALANEAIELATLADVYGDRYESRPPRAAVPAETPQRRPVARAAPDRAPAPRAAHRDTKPGNVAELDGIVAGGRRILEALALFPGGLSRRALGLWSLQVSSAGGFRNALSEVRNRGLIDEQGGTLRLSAAGEAAAAACSEGIPTERRALVDAWCGKLTGRARDMLRHLVAVHPSGCSRAELAEAVGMVASAGGFRNYVSMLAKRELVHKRGRGELAAADELFLREGRH